jgi:hypothetical protein
LIKFSGMTWTVSISTHITYRAKSKALEVIDGDYGSHYYRISTFRLCAVHKSGQRGIVNTIVNQIQHKNLKFHAVFYCMNAQV